MVSQVLQLLRQGVWAALTGGWYHDPEQSKFTNSCHLYLWLFLLLLPLALHLAFPPNVITALFYCSSVTVLFTVIKVVSYRLHLVFDKGEVIQQRSPRQVEKPKKDREANSEHATNPKIPSSTRPIHSSKKEEIGRSVPTPPLHCSSRGQSLSSHRSSGPLELPAQETVEDLKGVVLSEDHPGAPVSSTSPGIRTDSLPASQVCLPEPMRRSAEPTKPAVPEALISGKGRGQEGQGQHPPRHRSEGGLVDKGDLKKLQRLSLSQYDLLETDVSFQPWGSENSVLIPEPLTCHQDSISKQLQSKSPQDSLSNSCPQCHTVMAKPTQRLVGTSSHMALPFSQGVNSSDSEVAVTLIDTSQPGDPLSLHEPIKIVITMSSTSNSTTEVGSSLHLKVTGTEQVSPGAHIEPASPRKHPTNAEHIRIPVITLELSEDGGGSVTVPEGQRNRRTSDQLNVGDSDQCSSGELGRATQACSSGQRHAWEPAQTPTSAVASEAEGETDGQASLDPVSCRGSHEKRHARVLSVDSGTDVFLSRSSTEVVSDKEKTIPTSKSDLEAKEGQIPNESNFLEFVSLLESINTSKVVASTQPKDPADQHGAGEAKGLREDHYSQKKEEILEKEKPSGQQSKPEKPELQSQDHPGTSPMFSPPARTTALFQGNRQRQIIYRVTSQQDSSVLQVISGPETSVQEEMSVDAMHVFMDEHGEIKSCYLKSGNQKESSFQYPPLSEDCASQGREVHLSSSSTTTCESPDPSSGDPAVSALQQQLLLMVARRTHSETPRGHNQIITYSRPIYFCVLCGLILLLDAEAKSRHPPRYVVYGLKLFSPESLQTARDHLIVFLYCFPVISLLGLFPQINTFCTYLLEQIDMLLFGGSAVSGIVSALYSVGRSILAAALLHVFCFSAVKEPWSTQHIPALFSAFCGLLVALSYHLSRQSSDPSVLLSFIQCRLFPKFLHQSLEESATDPLPQKMKDSVKDVLRSDLVVCSVAAVLSFAVSASTVFLSLRPFLSVVLFALAGTVGFITHHLLPQLRKHHPWMWVSHPVLKSREYQQREVGGQ